MSINSVIREALLPIVPNVVADVYEGDALEYITFNYTIIPSMHADDYPQALTYVVTVHYCCPKDTYSLVVDKPISTEDDKKLLTENGDVILTTTEQNENVMHKRKRIRRALARLGTYPTENNLTDEKAQEYVYTFQMADGDM